MMFSRGRFYLAILTAAALAWLALLAGCGEKSVTTAEPPTDAAPPSPTDRQLRQSEAFRRALSGPLQRWRVQTTVFAPTLPEEFDLDRLDGMLVGVQDDQGRCLGLGVVEERVGLAGQPLSDVEAQRWGPHRIPGVEPVGQVDERSQRLFEAVRSRRHVESGQELFEQTLGYRFVQLLLGAEVVVQQRTVDSRLVRYLLQPRPVLAFSREDPEGGLEDPRLGIQVLGTRRDL